MTWARTAAEEALLIRSLSDAATLGLPMAIADRNVRPEFIERLARLPRTVVVSARGAGLVPQIMSAFDAAETFAPEMMLYTEPDKEASFRALPLDCWRVHGGSANRR
jgi:hypothetical protein